MNKNFKIYKLRDMKDDELSAQLDKFREELYQLRTSKVVGATATKLGRIRVVRKAIARCLTVINGRLRAEYREQYRDHAKKPYDLRGKKTRAIRRRLTKAQRNKKTLRQEKRAKNFSKRQYALRK